MHKKYGLIYFCILLLVLSSCTSNDINTTNNSYKIHGKSILYNKEPIQFVGANALHSFAVGSADMVSWNLNISREFIGNMNENPIVGSPIQDSNGQFLYSLQSIVDDNRSNNLVTILTPFGWDGTEEKLLTGKFPTETAFWSDFKLKLELWSTHFKDQSDVWIEVWNEPFIYDRSDGYTDSIWKSTMNELYTVVRSTGNDNIILIPCAEQGQDESVLLHSGANFLVNKKNVLYDIHAYEKWLLDTPNNINVRINALIELNVPVFFGEVAPVNSGVLMNPQYFLNVIHAHNMSFAAWLWKYDESDQDALLTAEGLPNNYNNNNWGSLYNEIALRAR
ncbi:cellulase family glycosylhydrolase [Winogradskyella alexanderae]|uniref:Glycoside hydrolase family 5 protein n=1 Tax=Winogradskyella alexanderae TaxID=2877123 RepID=A0ABS7XPT8_9FLAO|nr:cellulase family glycosylhydrolase [Winogradskyella alexanderae]MCA0131468.1 glycoside hydrolase family 5 protein [Winogradskyella alexanderae]